MRIARRFAQTFLIALVALIALAALLLWVSGTEPALRWVAGQIVEQTQGKLALEGIRGSLHGPLSIDRLMYEDAERRLEVSNLTLDWIPWGLLRRTLRVSSIHADSISVSIKDKTDAPAKLPDDLDLPLAYELDAITVGRLTLASADARAELTDLAMQARYGGETHAVTLERLGTPWGEAKAQLALGDRRPFPIKGEVTFNAAAQELAANATLDGSLTELRLKASAQAKALKANAALTATPFEPAPLKSIELDARGVDPSAWRKNLPKADLHVKVIAEANSGQPMRGHATAENAIPGALDSGRVPFRALSSDIASDFSQLTLSEIRLDLGEAGTFQGHGSLEGGLFKLDLVTGDLNLKGIESSLYPTSLKGAIQLAGGEAEQSLSADFQQAGYHIELNAMHGAERFTLNRAQIAAGSARLALSGSMDLAAAQSFDVKGELSRFNPAEFGEYPSARVNAEFALQGERAPELEATLKFAIRDSQFRGERLSGDGDVVFTASRIARSDAKVALGPNQLALHGSFGNLGDILNFRVDAPRLASLGPRFAGNLKASGVLRGDVGSPEIKATIEATNVKAPDEVAAGRLQAELRASVVDGAFAQPEATFNVKAVQVNASGGQRLANLDARGEVQRGLDGRLKLDVTASGYRSPALSIDSARLAVAGTRGEHRIELSAKGDALDLSAQARGGIEQANSWSGTLQQIVNRGGYPLSLREPAALEIAPERFNLRDARFDLGAGIFEVGVFSLDREGITTRGVFRDFPTSYLAALVPKEMPIKSSLALSGEWNIAATNTLNGVVSMRRDRGDLVVLQPETIPLQLSALELHIEARQNAVSARFDAAGSTLGTASARGETFLKKVSGNWQLPDTAAITAQAQADMPSIAWASPLLPIDGVLGGRIRLQLSAGGSVAEPSIQATLTGDALSFALQESDFRLTDGRLRARLQTEPTLGADPLRAELEFSASPLGKLSAVIETALERGWTLRDNAPLSIRANAEMPSIAWAAAFAKPLTKLDGVVRASLESRGTVASPKMNAIVIAEGVDASIADLHLEDGTIRAEVTSDLEREGSLAAKVELSALPFARVEAHLRTAYARKDGAWGLLASAPFKLDAQATAPSLGWVAAFIGPGATVEGSVQLAASADGTVANPQFQGTVAGDNLNLVLAQLGVDLEEGILRAEFEGKELFLREFRMQGGDGNLSITGKIDLAQLSPAFNLRVKADRLRALNRPDRLLELTGAGNLQLSEKRLLATGAFTVNRGIIALPKTDTPQLAQDVVIVGQEQQVQRSSNDFPASVDVKIDLGEQLYLSGRGIDARLAGEIRLISESKNPLRAVGVIRVVQGKYSAYGQQLTIERGILNFSGPIDNPNLDVLAMRKNQPVEAGIEITGTALTPRATLVSNPNVPDTEKLSWLVLGHGLDGASRAEFDVIQAAAGALLSRGESATVQARIAQATGLDEVGVKGSGEGLQGAVLTLGKRISSRVYVSYEQGITGASNLVKIKYTLTPRWTVQTQAGSDSAVDVFYTLSFD